MVGSIIEAILVDYLLSSGYKPPKNEDVLKYDLGKLIETCKNEGALSDKTKELSAAVKTYRNLIHPGRMIRLNEKVDRNSANVARSLLLMILEEVSEHKRERYGYTAEQIASKVEKDPSSLSILTHLLKDTKEPEIERLLLKILPDRYFELEAQYSSYEGWVEDDDETVSRLARCFRMTFDVASNRVKVRATQRFVSIVKEAEHNTVLTYEDRFFRASDLVHVSRAEASMIKEHLISRLKEGRSLPLLIAFEGIQPFLVESDISGLVDALVSEAVNGKALALKSRSQKLLIELWHGASSPLDEGILARLQDWKKRFEKKGMAEPAAVVDKIIDECEIIPF